jgi:hypothetical protein
VPAAERWSHSRRLSVLLATLSDLLRPSFWPTGTASGLPRFVICNGIRSSPGFHGHEARRRAWHRHQEAYDERGERSHCGNFKPGVGCRCVTRSGCLRGGTGSLRFRHPCGSRPEGLARRCRRPLRSGVPRTPTSRPVACQARLWRSERPRRKTPVPSDSMVHSACCFSVTGNRPTFGGTLRQRCCETSDPVRLTTHQGLAHKAY